MYRGEPMATIYLYDYSQNYASIISQGLMPVLRRVERYMAMVGLDWQMKILRQRKD